MRPLEPPELEEIRAAVRALVERNRVVAEGAGATPVAAALLGRAGGGKIVCVVSGGNIDAAKLAKILARRPEPREAPCAPTSS